MENKYFFTSQRLGFREWKESDLEPFIDMNQDLQVMRYMPSLLSPKETAAFYDRICLHHQTLGYCYYAVDHIESGNWIGYIGFQNTRFDASFTPATEIGYRLLPQYWNQGIATEGALACLQYGWSQLHLVRIVSFTAKINLPSQKVMQKIGLKYQYEFDHPFLPTKHALRRHVLYELHHQI